jgi:hypothetical protein
MTYQVLVVAEAEEQLRRANEWWVANRRSAPDLLLDEFERAVFLLEEMPGIGARFQRATIAGTRRILLPKSRHWVYYTMDPARTIVYVLAIWSAIRGSDPPLSHR